VLDIRSGRFDHCSVAPATSFLAVSSGHAAVNAQHAAEAIVSLTRPSQRVPPRGVSFDRTFNGFVDTFAVKIRAQPTSRSRTSWWAPTRRAALTLVQAIDPSASHLGGGRRSGRAPGWSHAVFLHPRDGEHQGKTFARIRGSWARFSPTLRSILA
jgi:hypothetical protein